MAAAQENRFARLAVARDILSRDQVEELREFQARKREHGSRIPIWDCAVLKDLLDEAVAEKLREEAGDVQNEKLGEFTLIRKLGEGGMGSVYLGIDPRKQRAAIKVLTPQLARERTYLSRFFREGQASMKLQHENIVRGIDIGEDSGYYFFAMEYVDGKSCLRLIEEKGALAPQRASEIILQVADALAYAHQNDIIHRDIKPENIMLTREGVPKLMDLGLARQMGTDMTALTRTGTAMGTPYYMAPEQVMDAKRVDERADLYSLGATWYHMLTGRAPFEGDTSFEVFQKHIKEPLKSPRAVRQGIPRAVSRTVERLMAKKPDGRIQSAEELCRVIRDECMGEHDILRELRVQDGAENREATLYDMQIPIWGKLEQRRFSVSEVRMRIRRGQVTPDTPTRRADEDGAWRRADDYKELAAFFPREYRATAKTQKSDSSMRSTEVQLHHLLDHFEEETRIWERSRRQKRILPYVIEIAGLLLLGFLLWQFWPRIWSVLAGLFGGGASA